MIKKILLILLALSGPAIAGFEGPSGSSSFVGILPASKGGTGVSNSQTLTLAGTGNATLTLAGVTGVTLPTSGTLVNSDVTALSSLATVGTITSGVWNAGAVTAAGAITGSRFIPTSNTVPTNGMYFPASNTLGFSTNSALFYSVSANNFLFSPSTTAFAYANSITPKVQVAGTTANTYALGIAAFSADAVGGTLNFAKSRNASNNGHTIVQSGDVLGQINIGGDNGTTQDLAAQMLFESGGTPGASADMPGQWRLMISPDGSATPTERLKVTQAGVFSVTGTMTTSGNFTSSGGVNAYTATDSQIVLGTATDNYTLGRNAASGSLTFTGSQAGFTSYIFNAGLVSGGTKFTISGCSAGTTVGGAAAGTFVSGTTGACTVVITINGATGQTAPTGWACNVNNRTTANLIRQTASTTTTATVSGTTVTGDVISFNCTGY